MPRSCLHLSRVEPVTLSEFRYLVGIGDCEGQGPFGRHFVSYPRNRHPFPNTPSQAINRNFEHQYVPRNNGFSKSHTVDSGKQRHPASVDFETE